MPDIMLDTWIMSNFHITQMSDVGLPAGDGDTYIGMRKLFTFSQWPLVLGAYFLLNFYQICSFCRLK